MLKTVKPRNARSKRAMQKREPQVHENPKTTLFLKGSSCSQVANLVLADLNSLKRPLSIKFTKKNNIQPFEDPSSLEFFSQKNDASILVLGNSTKKRPHALTFTRTFEHKVLDMLELYINPDTMRTLQQFKTTKPATGLKPLLSFSGTPFESPVPTPYTLAKSLFLDLFHGEPAAKVDVTGLQYMMHFSAGEEQPDTPPPQIHLRVYLLKTKRSGQKLPRVELEEMGPRIDFRVGRVRQPEEEMWKEAMRKPRGTEARPKKNVETDLMGDKLGRIHMGDQELNKIQTRKMKGLKRGRDEIEEDVETLVEEGAGKRERLEEESD